jgi:hypothetical protein
MLAIVAAAPSSAAGAADGQALTPTAPSHQQRLRSVLAERCDDAPRTSACRRSALTAAMRRVALNHTLTGELDFALATAFMEDKAQQRRASLLVSQSKPPVSPELSCWCDATLYGPASDRIFGAPTDGDRGEPNACPGADDGSLAANAAQLFDAYGLDRRAPGQPYCSQGGSFSEPFADLCDPCGIAEKPGELSVVFPSGLHQNKDANGNGCYSPTAEDFMPLVGVQYRNTQWTWLEVDMADEGNTLTQVGGGSDTSPAYWKLTVTSAKLPAYWFGASLEDSFGIAPDTPYRVMLGVRHPSCPAARKRSKATTSLEATRPFNLKGYSNRQTAIRIADGSSNR